MGNRRWVKVQLMGHLVGFVDSRARNSGADEEMWIIFLEVAERRGSNHLASEIVAKVPSLRLKGETPT